MWEVITIGKHEGDRIINTSFLLWIAGRSQIGLLLSFSNIHFVKQNNFSRIFHKSSCSSLNLPKTGILLLRKETVVGLKERTLFKWFLLEFLKSLTLKNKQMHIIHKTSLCYYLKYSLLRGRIRNWPLHLSKSPDYFLHS